MALNSQNLYVQNPLQDAWNARYGNGAKMAAAGVDPNNWRATQNWQLQDQRNTGLSDFVNNMSLQEPSSQGISDRFNTANTNAGGMLTNYLNTSPTSAPNRFEGALSDTTGRINALLDNPDSINKSAAYKFQLDQGTENTLRHLGSSGQLGSGNRLAELQKFGQGLASQEYGNQFDRLAGLLGTNTSAWLGDKSANTSAWGAKAGALGNYYGTTSNALNENQGQRNNERLGWANAYSKNTPPPQYWSLT